MPTTSQGMVLARPELVGRAMDWLPVKDICAQSCVAKTFGDVAGYVEHFDHHLDIRIPARVWQKFARVTHVRLVWRPAAESYEALSAFFDAAALVSGTWRVLSLGLPEVEGMTLDQKSRRDQRLRRGLRELTLAVASGALSRLDWLYIDLLSGNYSVIDAVEDELQALAEALPPYCGASLAMNYFAPDVLGQILERHPNFDVNYQSDTAELLLSQWTSYNFQTEDAEFGRTLLAKGANPHIISRHHDITPFESACGNSLSHVKILHEADDNIPSASCLRIACGGLQWVQSSGMFDVNEACWKDAKNCQWHSDPELVSYLLELGVDALETFEGGRRALDFLKDRLAEAHAGLESQPENAHIRDVIRNLEKMMHSVSNAAIAQALART